MAFYLSMANTAMEMVNVRGECGGGAQWGGARQGVGAAAGSGPPGYLKLGGLNVHKWDFLIL